MSDVPFNPRDPTRGAGQAALRAAPRCGAWARSAGRPCRQWLVPGSNRCHWHGGRAGAPKGTQSRLTHGGWTPEAIAAKRAQATEQRAVEAKVKSLVAEVERIVSPPKKRGRPRKVQHGET